MIKLVCVGKIKENFIRDGITEYTKRLSAYDSFSIIEV
jgi:23S rRNA (pseudouridine1915-N3)-methyltransferase